MLLQHTNIIAFNGIFIKNCFDALVLISLPVYHQFKLDEDQSGGTCFYKMSLSNNISMLKEYRGPFRVYYAQDLK